MKMADHIDEEQLDSYVLGRLTGSELDDLEEHLLICEECRNRVEELDSLIDDLRAACKSLNLQPVRMTHVTADGPIRLWVEKTEDEKWSASFSGSQLEGGQPFPKMRDANEYVLRAFSELFPEHVCGKECDPGLSGSSPLAFTNPTLPLNGSGGVGDDTTHLHAVRPDQVRRRRAGK